MINDEIYIRRTSEENLFKEQLNDLNSCAQGNEPFGKIFLIYGHGGMGKTTLLKKLEEMSKDEPFTNKFTTLYLNWEDELSNLMYPIKHDSLQPETILELIYQKFITKKERKNSFQEYIKTQQLLKEAQDKLKKAEEEREKYGLNIDPELTPEEQDICKRSANLLPESLGRGIAKLAKEKPLIIFLDTYEMVDATKCDSALRQVMKETMKPENRNVLWVVAGRSNLNNTVWRNPIVENTLNDALEDEDPDIVAATIRSLGKRKALEIRQLISFLGKPDKYIREAAAEQLGILANDRKKFSHIIPAVQPLIDSIRNDYMQDVREAAKKAGSIIDETDSENSQVEEELKAELKRTLRLAKAPGFEDEYELEMRNPTELLTRLNIQHLNQSTTDDLIRALKYNEQQADNNSFVRLQAAATLEKLTSVDAIDALNTAVRQDKFSNVRDAAEKALVKYIRKDSNIPIQDKQKAFDYLSLIYGPNLYELYEKRIDKEKWIKREEIDSEINQNTTHKNIFSGNDNIKTIIDALKNNFDVNKKRQAAQALGNYPEDQEVLTALINALEKEQQPDVDVAIASSLGKLKNSQALKPLLKKLKELENGDRIARAAVVEALSNLNISKEEIENSEKEENREERLLTVLIDRWRNETMSNLRAAIKETLWNLSLSHQTFSKPIRKALKKYSKDPYLNDNQLNLNKDLLLEFFRDWEEIKERIADVFGSPSKEYEELSNLLLKNEYLLNIVHTRFLLEILIVTLQKQDNKSIILQLSQVNTPEHLFDAFIEQSYNREKEKDKKRKTEEKLIYYSLEELKQKLGEIAVLMLMMPDENVFFEEVMPREEVSSFAKLASGIQLIYKKANQTDYYFRDLLLKDYFAFSYANNFLLNNNEQNSNVITKEQVVKALGKINNPRDRVVELIIDVFKNEKDSDVRYEAINALGAKLDTNLYVRGYDQEFQDKVIDVNLGEFNQDDVEEYFNKFIPENNITVGDLEKIYNSSRGIPLVVNLYATECLQGFPLDDIIVEDGYAHDKLVEKACRRFLNRIYQFDNVKEDRRVIYTLTMMRYNSDGLLQKLLNNSNLELLSSKLNRRYSFISISSGELKLENQHKFFFRQYLLRKKDHDEIVKEIHREGRKYFEKLWESLTKIPFNDRFSFSAENWIKEAKNQEIISNWIYYWFWKNEEDGWHYLTRYLILGWYYNLEWARSLLEIPAWFNITPDREDLLRIFKLGLPPSERQTSPLKDQLRLIRHLYPKIDKVTSLKKESLAIFFLKYGDLLYGEDEFESALVEYEKAKDIVSQLKTNAKLLSDEINDKIKKISEKLENKPDKSPPQSIGNQQQIEEQAKQNFNPNEDQIEKDLEQNQPLQIPPDKLNETVVYSPPEKEVSIPISDNKKLTFQLKFEHLIVLMLPLYIILIILGYLLYEQNNNQEKIQAINQQGYKKINEQEHEKLINSAITFGKDDNVRQGLKKLCKIPSYSQSFGDAKWWIKRWSEHVYWGKELPSILEDIKKEGSSCPAADEVYLENIDLIKK